ncbi:MAG: site-specific integrase [Flavobacteriales bacterium]|nr:site-specific integrase [Flavobacteriales bacterium]
MNDFDYYPAEYKRLKRNYVEFSYMVNGRMQRVRKYFDHYRNKTFGEKKAREYARQINAKLSDGWRPGMDTGTAGRVALKAAIANVLAIKYEFSRVRTVQSYRAHYNLLMHLISLVASDGITCEEFTQEHAAKAMDLLVKLRKPSGTTYNNYLTNYRSWWNELIERGHVKDNPFAKLKPKKQKRAENRVFSDAELKALVDHLRETDVWFLMACQLLYYGGVRRSELVGLKVSALEGRCILIPGEVAKNGKARTVALPEPVADELAALLQSSQKELFLFGKGLEPHEKKAWPNRISERFAQHREALGMDKRLKFYGLKDTAAERLLRSGVDVSRIRDLYDHSSVAITDAYLKRRTGVVDEALADNFPPLV